MPQNILYANLRSTPSPHPQAYAAALDYGSQLSLMMPGAALYAHAGMSAPAMHLYQQGGRSGRRGDDRDHNIAIRSPVLDDFRANKTRKWEIRVSRCVVPSCAVILTFDYILGYIWLHCRVQRRSAWVSFHSTEARDCYE